MPSLTLSQLESHLWKAAWLLKGLVDAADFKTYIFPMLFFKRLSDVHDEEHAAALKEFEGDEEAALFPENYRFQVPEGCHWRDVRKVAVNVGQALQTALHGIKQANPHTLYGIFGDAAWTNKDRLPDKLLRDLIEHFSALPLGNSAAETDILGQAYEYLIKCFADATNKKAGEPECSGDSQPQAARRANEVRQFYTPRSVVRLMVNILDPREGESIYDPTCGTGGMLLEAIHHVKETRGDVRTLWGKLYGQDKWARRQRPFGLAQRARRVRRRGKPPKQKNLTTSAIARINLFLHGATDFKIVRGDTLRNPAFYSGDNLATFDCVIATTKRDSASSNAKPYRRACRRQDHPPYSIKQWDRDALASDPWGRNLYGTPPQGRADYAFQQHILQSLKPKTGRCAVLWPHGVLFRQEEAEMRRKLIEADLIECVLGLGPNLFYNSPMEACVVVCRTQKPKARRRKILFINAVNEVTRERAQSFLTDEHLQRIVRAYQDFKDEPGFTRVVPIEEIRAKEGNLSIPLYVGGESSVVREDAAEYRTNGLRSSLTAWLESSSAVRHSLDSLLLAK